MLLASLAAAQEVQITSGEPAPIRRRPDWENASSVEITTAIGLVDVGRVGPGLLPYGYDREGGPMGTLDVRVMVARNRAAERLRAAEELDHGSLGGFLGASTRARTSASTCARTGRSAPSSRTT